jgi:hypothetical protein
VPGVELFAAPLLSCTMGGSVGMGGCWLLGRVTVGVCTVFDDDECAMLFI